MDDRSNTIAGWVLGAGIAALGFTILSGEIFHAETPHEGKQGWAIEGEAEGGAEAAAVPIANVMADAMAADGVAKGEAVFKKCTACHTIAAGGAAGIGPNLHGVVGKPIGGGSFAYSEALKGVGGTWSFESLNSWLTNPKKFAAGNKMTFAGLGKAEDRAAVMLYLNSQGSNLPLPAAVAAPAAGAAPADGAAVPAGEAAAAQAPAPAAGAPAAATPAPAPAK
jgi:cytochrome c